LKEAGYWLVGLDEQGDKNYTEVDYTSPVGIVVGSEGQGLHELTRKRCDFVVSLPTTGPVKSLNVSVAAVGALSRHPNVIGMKDSAGDVRQLEEIMKVVPETFNLIVGTAAASICCKCV